MARREDLLPCPVWRKLLAAWRWGQGRFRPPARTETLRAPSFLSAAWPDVPVTLLLEARIWTVACESLRGDGCFEPSLPLLT